MYRAAATGRTSPEEGRETGPVEGRAIGRVVVRATALAVGRATVPAGDKAVGQVSCRPRAVAPAAPGQVSYRPKAVAPGRSGSRTKTACATMAAGRRQALGKPAAGDLVRVRLV